MDAEADSRTTRLDARYGRTPGSRRRGRLFAGAALGAVVVVVVAWVVWAGLSGSAASLETRDLGYETPDASTVDVRFQISVEPGSGVTCALQALDSEFAIVGWKIVELPPSEVRSNVYDEPVRTSGPAVTGLIYRCWLT
jgi:hypothetical protein